MARLARVALPVALGGALAGPLLASHTSPPSSVTLAGSFQSELGCPGDWQPDCALTHLSYDPADDVWQGTFDVPAGNWEYKASLNDSWSENYGRYAQRDGPNIPLNIGTSGAVKFYYDHKSHWVTSNRTAVIATVPGSFQSELGCPGDWEPECLRSWLQDPLEDGIYTFSTSLPAGSYEAKVAINESWDENYGDGGARNGANIPFTVSQGGTEVVFSYNPGTHVLTISSGHAPPVPIYVIQGDGRTSPFAGTQQTTTGIVTVILGNGFFMQDPVGDGDPNTSDGIFVFGPATARTLSPGDEVTVIGTVTDFRPSSRPRDLTLTEFSPATVVVTGSGRPLPAPVLISDRPDSQISPEGIDAFEALEGMLVEIVSPKVVGPTNAFGEFHVVAAGDASHTTVRGNLLLQFLGPDDVDYNPERIIVDDEVRVPGGTGSGTRINNPQVQVVVGDEATGNIVGALDYRFGNYRVQANHPVSDVLTGSTPPSPVGGLRAPAPYEGRVSTFNVGNLFDCVDAPGKDDRASCSAADHAALETQLTKLAKAFEEELGNPEIVIIEGTENTEVLTGDASGFVPGTSVPALLPRLSGNYGAVSFDASDERGIETAFVFNRNRVTLHDAFLATDILPDSEGIFNGTAFRPGREPLVGSFTLDGIDLIVVGNHLKSKDGPQFGVDPTEAGDDPLYGAFQPPTRWTEVQLRHKQADYVRGLVDFLLTQNPAAKILVGGDLNDFQFPEPGEGQDTVARIKESPTDPLVNVIDLIPEAERYSFIFEGNSQVLDHMLLNAGLAGHLRDQGIGNFNADFPVSFESNPAVTFRSSDHDSGVTYFCTDVTPPSLAASVSPDTLWPPDQRYVVVQATVNVADNADPGSVLRLVSVTSNEPDTGLVGGDQPNDIVIVDDLTFSLRAERSPLGSGRVYTITYQATDACGNSTVATAPVTVPHNLRP